MAEKKVIGRPFQKGVSGNPSGRSEDTHTISQLAKAYTEEAIEKLAEIMRTGKTEQTQVRAAEALLDRGWGKAAQHIGGSDGSEAIRVYLKNYRFDPETGAVETNEPAARIIR
jgi:hypothetical protein